MLWSLACSTQFRNDPQLWLSTLPVLREMPGALSKILLPGFCCQKFKSTDLGYRVDNRFFKDFLKKVYWSAMTNAWHFLLEQWSSKKRRCCEQKERKNRILFYYNPGPPASLFFLGTSKECIFWSCSVTITKCLRSLKKKEGLFGVHHFGGFYHWLIIPWVSY